MKKLLTALFLSAALGSGCASDETRISDMRAGTEDEPGTGYLGGDLPVYARIQAPDTIETFEVELRPASAERGVMRTSFEDLKGMTRGELEDRISLDPELEPGNYSVVFTAYDRKGVQFSEEIQVRLLVNSSLPAITGLEVGINTAGDDLHLAAHVVALNTLQKIEAEVIGEQWSKTFEFGGSKLEGSVEYHFHDHIAVGDAPSGRYKVVLKAFDQKGKQVSVTGSFEKR